MSLQVRLVVSLVLILLLSLGVGGGVAGWHAVRSVRAEMRAALDVGAQTVRNGLQELPAIGRAGDLEHLVYAFDGDRHVQAVLFDANGQALATSRLHRLRRPLPAWFIRLLAPSLTAPSFVVGGGDTIVLRPDPRNEIGEVWTQLTDDCVAIGLFCGLSLLLTSLVVGRALRPLERLSMTLRALGAGDYAARVQPAGPPELARLAHGVNAMAEQLQAAQVRNQRLQDQILMLQEEERADLARDLHDEIGPFLFAVHLDVAAIEQATKAGLPGEVTERAKAIRDAVLHMQTHVRAMLQRLRPVNPVEGGLALALDNLVAFWRARRPAIAFVLRVKGLDDALPTAATAAAYRLVQESLSNAIRHGDPGRIEVLVDIDDAGALDVQVIDDGMGLVPAKEPGLGLIGMRERIGALGGALRIGAGAQGKGLAVVAHLPSATVLEGA